MSFTDAPLPAANKRHPIKWDLRSVEVFFSEEDLPETWTHCQTRIVHCKSLLEIFVLLDQSLNRTSWTNRQSSFNSTVVSKEDQLTSWSRNTIERTCNHDSTCRIRIQSTMELYMFVLRDFQDLKQYPNPQNYQSKQHLQDSHLATPPASLKHQTIERHDQGHSALSSYSKAMTKTGSIQAFCPPNGHWNPTMLHRNPEW